MNFKKNFFGGDIYKFFMSTISNCLEKEEEIIIFKKILHKFLLSIGNIIFV